jgi:hypothetical protein
MSFSVDCYDRTVQYSEMERIVRKQSRIVKVQYWYSPSNIKENCSQSRLSICRNSKRGTFRIQVKSIKSPEDGNRAGFRNVVCRFIAICVFWFFVLCVFFRSGLLFCGLYFGLFVFRVCVCSGLFFCGLYFGLFGVFSYLSIIFFWFWDTRRWINSRNTLRLMH